MTTQKIRIGIIGCGRIAQTHAAALDAIEKVDFAACCDIVVDRARALADKYGVPLVSSDPAALLASGDVDVVMVCTPHPSHAPLVIAAAEAGVHVLVEKPMTIDLAEADRMIEAADRAGVKFGVIFQRRFWPSSQRIRRAIDDGLIGRPILGECFAYLWRGADYYGRDPWRGKWDTEGGGVLMNQAVHVLDLLQWFMGPMVEVHGRWANLAHQGIIDVEDTAVATVLFEGGSLGVITAATSFQPPIGFRVSVLGETGSTLSVLESPESQQGVNDVWTLPGREHEREAWEAEEANRPGFPLFHEMQIRDFLEAISDDREPAVTGREARKAIALITAIYRSQETGLAVRIATDR
jgi:UDP-N-acetyl-2-amino-2-deoxyglucuronate dehydrogenase